MEVTIGNYTFQFTPAEFRAWLNSKPEGFNCAKRDPCSCPMAMFFYEKGRGDPSGEKHFWISVSPEDVTVGKPDGARSKSLKIDLPFWARVFVHTWDHVDLIGSRQGMLESLDKAEAL